MQLIKCMAIRCNIIRESNVNPLCAVRALAVHCGTVYTSVSAKLCNALPIVHELMRTVDAGDGRAAFPEILVYSLPKDGPSVENKVHPGTSNVAQKRVQLLHV